MHASVVFAMASARLYRVFPGKGSNDGAKSSLLVFVSNEGDRSVQLSAPPRSTTILPVSVSWNSSLDSALARIDAPPEELRLPSQDAGLDVALKSWQKELLAHI